MLDRGRASLPRRLQRDGPGRHLRMLLSWRRKRDRLHTGSLPSMRAPYHCHKRFQGMWFSTMTIPCQWNALCPICVLDTSHSIGPINVTHTGSNSSAKYQEMLHLLRTRAMLLLCLSRSRQSDWPRGCCQLPSGPGQGLRDG